MKKLNISQASPVTAGFDALVTALRSTLVFDEKPAFTMVGFHFFYFSSQLHHLNPHTHPFPSSSWSGQPPR